MTAPTLPPDLSFKGQTIIVTGATSGLGFEAAIHYVSFGAKTVIITGRSLAKVTTAKAQIEARTGKTGVVQAQILDMDSFANVRSFVTNLKKEVLEVDIVLLNAGIHTFNYSTIGPWEAMLHVNTLASLLLGKLILDWMRDIQKPAQVQHLTFTGSGAHIGHDVEGTKWPKQNILDFWNRPENFVSGHHNYGISKLFLLYGVRELAKIATSSQQSSPPIVTVVCPGVVDTNLPHDFARRSFLHRLVVWSFVTVKGSSAAVGAQSLVLASIAPSNKHGEFLRPYLTDAQYKSKAKNVFSPAGERMQAVVWQEILDIFQTLPEV